MFYDVHKENMFRTNLEDGREAPSKASYTDYNLILKCTVHSTIVEYSLQCTMSKYRI